MKTNLESLKTMLKTDHEVHTFLDPHQRSVSGLSDIILGGQDGLVNVLGVILGIAAATSDTHLVLIAGLAATFAESVSMGAVAFTSTMADADYYDSELEREIRHIEQVPKLERDEVRQIYAKKGFTGELLQHIVDTITANPDVWVAVMMSEEHQISPVDRKQAWKVALIVGISAIIGSLIPLLPFTFLSVVTGMWVSVVLTALVLFFIGGYKARMTVGHPGRSGIEMALIGTLSALVGYAVGALLKVPTTP